MKRASYRSESADARMQNTGGSDGTGSKRCVQGMLVAVILSGPLLLPSNARSGGVLLENGTIILGRPFEVQAVSKSVPPNAGNVINRPVMLIDDGMRRYYVPVQKVVNVLENAGIGAPETFDLKMPRRSKKPILGAIGPMKDVTPFDVNGRRQVTLNTPRGPVVIDQQITEIGPRHMDVSALQYEWEFGVATRSIPVKALDEMIRNVTDKTSPEDRFAIVRFFLQAELYLQALKELESIAKDFPDLNERAEEFANQARQQLAQTLLDELKDRRKRGQHFLAWSKARQFPVDDMSSSILRQVREFLNEYTTARQDGEEVVALLGELQGELDSEASTDSEASASTGATASTDTDRQMLEAMRVEVTDRLNYETLSRMRPFLQQSNDPTRTTEEKLALAYSGWVMGDSAAVDSLPLATNLWRARFQVLRYLRETEPAKRTQILGDLLAIEGVGPETVLALIPQLPPLLDTPDLQPGQATEIVVDKAAAGVPLDSPDVRYHVLLPTEYSPEHTYPMVIALHSVERPPQWELRWWGGTAEEPLQAQRRGYIVIAPEYLDEDDTSYGYSPMSHYRVQMALRDARKRFNVDSDRVFLAGHGSGGSAAFDIGNAHPDLFAGVIPITGRVENLVVKIWRNGRRLPWYIVGGQLDRDTFEKNASFINRMMIAHSDVILTEFVGRGYESYYAEIHRLLDWMELHRRRRFPEEFDMRTVRPNNNRFFWLKADTLEPVRRARGRLSRTSIRGRAAARPKIVSAEILSGSDERTTISIRSPARKNTVWLSPEMIDFGLRLQVRVDGRRVYNDFVEASVEDILEDLRLRGDRQKIYQMRIDLE